MAWPRITMTQPTRVACALAAAVSAIAANVDMQYALLVNRSDVVIYLAMDGSAATVDRGIPLDPKGQYEMSHRFGNLTTKGVSAIAESGATKYLYVTYGI